MKSKTLFGFTAVALVAAMTTMPALQASAATGRPAAAVQPASGTGPGQSLSTVLSPSWQTNNTVWALAVANGVVYVGGQFTSVRPPGDALGTGEVARSYLAAFSTSTGNLLSFDPSIDGEVLSLAVSPDHNTLYVGGNFKHVSAGTGTPAYRDNLAAFNISTSTPTLTAWAPPAYGSVLSIAPSPDGTEVYLGGDFNELDLVARTFAGAVTSSGTGTLEPWAPVLNDSVTSVAEPADESQVLVGGYFQTINGVSQNAAGAVDPTTGTTTESWNNANIVPFNGGCTSAVKDIIIGGTTAYIAAEGTGGGCFDGDFAVSLGNVGTGGTNSLAWQNDCLGATQSLVIINGLLYKGSHAHDCAYEPGGFPQVENSSGTGWVTHHLLAQSLTDGTIQHWTGTDTSSPNAGLGPRVMATDGTQMFLGGDFTGVGQSVVAQQGFARFGPAPDTKPGYPNAPTVTSTSAGVDSVTISGVSDPDDGTLSYAIYRDSGKTPIATLTAVSWPWALPTLHYRDAGLVPGSSHTYTVTASDGTITTAKSAVSAPVTVASTSPAATYPNTVLSASPSFFWPLNETSGSTANDASPNGFNGIYESGTTQGVSGPINDGTNTPASDPATSFDGASGNVASASAVAGPQKFSIELWVKTTTDTGGKLIGFGNSQTGQSSNYDRHIYMMNDGQLVFGVYNSGTETVETPGVYNDGQWHYVVATFDSSAGSNNMSLYVDGQLIGTGTSSAAQAFNGYWRVGGDNLNGWNLDPWGSSSQGLTQPGTYWFNGSIGDVAVYPSALSAAQVAAHYAANQLQH